MKRVVIFLLVAVMVFGMVGCGEPAVVAPGGNADTPASVQPTPTPAKIETAGGENEMTDEEMERVQAIFKEYVGEELEYKPKYCGEWHNGNQYVTENFAYGQYIIDMDVNGQVHLVVWVQDKKGEEGRVTVYSRLHDGGAVMEMPDDGLIHLVDGQLGEYGTEVNGFIHYKVPAGTYIVTNEAKRAVVFVVADNDPNDERYYIPMKEGESAEIVVDEDAHIELSASSMIALLEKKY